MTKKDPLKRSHLELSASEVTDIEKTLLTNPADLASRMRLVKHYFFVLAGANASARTNSSYAEGKSLEEQKLKEHAAWIISNCPGSPLATELRYYVLPAEHPIAYSHCEKLWLEILAANPDDLPILENAARFWLGDKPEMSRRLAERGQQLNPQSEAWSELLELITALQSGSPVALLENHIVSLEKMKEKAARDGKTHLVQFAEEEIRKCEIRIKSLQRD